MDWNPETENTDEGEFVTRFELLVLHAAYGMLAEWHGSEDEARRAIADRLGCPISLVERVEALLYAEGAS